MALLVGGEGGAHVEPEDSLLDRQERRSDPGREQPERQGGHGKGAGGEDRDLDSPALDRGAAEEVPERVHLQGKAQEGQERKEQVALVPGGCP